MILRGEEEMLKRFREHRRAIVHWTMELVIVVAGVLIALTAQQWAQARSSKARADAAEARIRVELANDLYLSAERIALHQCLKQRLATLVEGLSSANKDWSTLLMDDPKSSGLRAFKRLYRVPSRVWQFDEYRGNLTGGALDSLSPERRAGLASLYAQFEKARDFNVEEGRLATELGALQYGTPFSGPERNALIATLMRLDHLNGLMVLIARQTGEGYRDLYRLTPEEIAADKPIWWASFAELRAIYGNCVDPQAVALLDERLLP